MKKKISFVAVGQAGGNIGQLLEEAGYSVLYVNTSQEDLDTLGNAKFRYHVPGGEGCNKDRHKAKQLIIDDFDNIAREIEAKVKADMVFVIFSSGGGTGSGAGPMLADLLIDEGIEVGIITIIPSLEESLKSQINSYECFSELMGVVRTAACFILDNGKGEKLGLNAAFVDSLKVFLDIPEMHKSIKGNIDKAEAMETLKAHGMAVIARDAGGDSPGIIQALKEGPFAPMEADRAVKYMAASLSGDARMADIEKAVGVPVDNFQTFNSAETICCISGLTYPHARLEAVYGKVEGSRELVERNLAAAMECGMKKGVNFLEGMELPGRKPGNSKPQSKRDIMSKYL
ncbi:MAG: hypothetical protein HFH36_13370 [Lachnospiraceae bacterium]|nr:hypothetical protein [Lachnospiraceae bacterium]